MAIAKTEAEISVLNEKGVKAFELPDDPETGKKRVYAHPAKTNKIYVNIPLSRQMDDDSEEQVETVIINGDTTRIKRGVPVAVTYDVFSVLKGRYPHI